MPTENNLKVSLLFWLTFLNKLKGSIQVENCSTLWETTLTDASRLTCMIQVDLNFKTQAKRFALSFWIRMFPLWQKVRFQQILSSPNFVRKSFMITLLFTLRSLSILKFWQWWHNAYHFCTGRVPRNMSRRLNV